METREVIVQGGPSGFTQTINAGGHTLVADEPKDVPGGKDKGPNPYELMLASLGACTSMTLRMYADLKKWPLTQITVILHHHKIHAEDCRNCETAVGKVDQIERDIKIEGDLSEEQRGRLLEIADRCPVSQTLRAEVNIQSRLI